MSERFHPLRVAEVIVETEDARGLSRALFFRLRELEEGTAEYSYVRNTLVELNLALVRYAAGRFRHRTEPTEDLLQVGIVGLIKAINRFDPAREVEFSTFASLLRVPFWIP